MKNLPFGKCFVFSLLFLSLSCCDFDHDALINHSYWAAIVVVAAMLLFFYYVLRCPGGSEAVN